MAWYVCPICRCGYSDFLRCAGQRCNDTSGGQKIPCVGRVIPAKQYAVAEWSRGDNRRFMEIVDSDDRHDPEVLFHPVKAN